LIFLCLKFQYRINLKIFLRLFFFQIKMNMNAVFAIVLVAAILMPTSNGFPHWWGKRHNHAVDIVSVNHYLTIGRSLLRRQLSLFSPFSALCLFWASCGVKTTPSPLSWNLSSHRKSNDQEKHACGSRLGWTISKGTYDS